MSCVCRWLIIVSGFSIAGCVTETVKSPPTVPHDEMRAEMRATTRTASGTVVKPSSELPPIATGKSEPPLKSPDPNTLTNSDPCAANLQNIAGAFLIYFATNQQLPDKLEELTKYSDADAPFTLACPLSHLPYVYDHDGLKAEGKSKVIILYDAAASHAGVRWCILMAAPKRTANRSLEVVAIPESAFRLYH